jgi:hypothetical protein
VLRKRYSFFTISLITGLIVVLSAGSIFGETNPVPKDPAFARRIGLSTGVVIPLFLGITGIGVASGAHDDDSTLFIGLTLSYLGILTPPLGNVYAGQINKKIALLYGAANLAYLAGTVSYYWKGTTTDQPTTFEGLMWFSAILLRVSSGVWDWMTASETAVRRNAEMRGMSPKGYLSPVLRPIGNSMNTGISYTIAF